MTPRPRHHTGQLLCIALLVLLSSVHSLTAAINFAAPIDVSASTATAHSLRGSSGSTGRQESSGRYLHRLLGDDGTLYAGVIMGICLLLLGVSAVFFAQRCAKRRRQKQAMEARATAAAAAAAAPT